MTKRALVLEDGTVFEGTAFGAAASGAAEVVFTTGMTGYQETLTDQSYNGQIVVFTYPLVGNTGINRDDVETLHPTTAGIVCRDIPRRPSNWRSQVSLSEFCEREGIPGLADIDTRALARHLRSAGVMKGIFVDARNQNVDSELSSFPPEQAEAAAEHLRTTQLPTNQVEQVSTQSMFPFPLGTYNVILYDFGMKHSILRELGRRGCNVTVVPWNTPASAIEQINPDGVVLSNGPGDPDSLRDVQQEIAAIEQKYPVFGICLGHQLLCLANGAHTYKLLFGHRGYNHPVRDLVTGRIDFTSQNHGYAVDPASLAGTDLHVTNVEINDDTIEGVRHAALPAFSVQFHPDATGGPHDGMDLFDRFISLMEYCASQHKAGKPFHAPWQGEKLSVTTADLSAGPAQYQELSMMEGRN
ncbi:MAG: glutamine-hydrolyzing carbamoyl-phosphate synthase small subunit [Actinomycetaceae bacterium]|nr:glutamine-hydrolyzing carbamoyl-phosphate synthase small subunit [Actinomycetaceae bacterium]MDY6083586.1 glutamine-hydrolyzing carbamoyl-phosphate synthase small subunit [Actinomycetaceae bacterium]